MSLVLLALLLVSVPLAFSPKTFLLKEGLASFLTTSMASVCLLSASGRDSAMRVRPALGPQVAGLLGVVAFSLLWAGPTWRGFTAAYQLVIFVGIYWLVSCTVHGEARVRQFSALMILSACLASVIGIIQVLAPRSFHTWATEASAVSTLVNTNHAAAYLLTVIPLAISSALVNTGRLARVCFWACALVATLGVIATQSRGAWVGLAAAMVLMTALLRWCSSPGMETVNWARLGLIAWLGLLLVLAAGELLLHRRGDSILPRVASIFDPYHPTNRFRFEWWTEAVQMIKDHPLLGVGIGNYAMARFPYSRYVDPRPASFLLVEHPHNEYLFAAAEMGLIGFLVWLWVLVSAGRLAWKDLSGARTTSTYVMTVGCAGALAGALVHSLWFYPWHSVSSALNLWVIMGFLEVLHRDQGEPVGSFASSVGRRSAVALAAVGLVVVLWLSFYRLSFKPLVADWYAGQGLFKLTFGNPAEGMADLQSALAWDDFDFRIPMQVGEVYFKTGEYDKAVDQYRRAAERAPGLPSAHANLGLSLYMAGFPDQAGEEYQKALRITSNYPVVHNNLGNMYLEKGDYVMAAEEYRKAIALSPQYANAHYNLGQVLVKTGQLGEALASYREAVSLDAANAEAWYNLASVSARLNRRDDVIAALTRALDLDARLRTIAREDADFQGMRNDERFRRVMADR